MNNVEKQDRPCGKLPIHIRLYLIGAVILIAGLIAAVVICINTSDEADDALAYGNTDASVFAVMPKESKLYNYQLERVGGKSAVLAAELDDWFNGLWQGKQLGYTIAFLSAAAALGFFMFARLLSFHPPREEKKDRKD
jgi:hypothetical protein